VSHVQSCFLAVHAAAVQTFRMTKAPRYWPPPAKGPHAASLSIAKNSFKPLDCKKQKLPQPTCSGRRYPSLEQLLCSLVYRADHPGAMAVNGTCESPVDMQAPGGIIPQRVLDMLDSVTSFGAYLARKIRRSTGRDEL
jgi:hypothetical protein